jgi:hypothetical protein
MLDAAGLIIFPCPLNYRRPLGREDRRDARRPVPPLPLYEWDSSFGR